MGLRLNRIIHVQSRPQGLVDNGWQPTAAGALPSLPHALLSALLSLSRLRVEQDQPGPCGCCWPEVLSQVWARSSRTNIKNQDVLCLQRRRLWFERIPWRRAWQPTQVFLPGEFHGQRSLEGYSQGRRESDTTEQLTLSRSPSGRLGTGLQYAMGCCAWKKGADGPKELQGLDNRPIMEATGRQSLTWEGRDLQRGVQRCCGLASVVMVYLMFRQRKVRSRGRGGKRGDGISNLIPLLVWNFWVCQNKRHNLRRTLHCKPLFCPELMSEIPSLRIHCFGLRCPLQNARLPSWYHTLINQSPYEGSEGRSRKMRMRDIGIASAHFGESKSPAVFLKKAKYKLSTGMINTLHAWVFLS